MKFERTKELNMPIEIYLTNRYYIEKIFNKYDNLLYCYNTARYLYRIGDCLYFKNTKEIKHNYHYIRFK